MTLCSLFLRDKGPRKTKNKSQLLSYAENNNFFTYCNIEQYKHTHTHTHTHTYECHLVYTYIHYVNMSYGHVRKELSSLYPSSHAIILSSMQGLSLDFHLIVFPSPLVPPPFPLPVAVHLMYLVYVFNMHVLFFNGVIWCMCF